MASNQILLVEDEPDVRDMLVFALNRADFDVLAVDSAEAGLAQLHGGVTPAAIIIDWMLPGMQGVDLAKRLRADEVTQETPLIMLTAKGEEADKLRGFDSGVDDYITKPFSPKELVARLRALMRRAGLSTDGILGTGDLKLDLRTHELTISGERVHIGPTEFRLLEFLISHPNRTFDRSQLLDRVWGRDAYVEERTVDVHVLRLRKLLKPYALEGIVQTVRGVGYRFQPVEKATA
ncbi:MAG: winged helix-turn-helix domain-containing protein [Pseudomonadota bacterium]